MLEITGTKLPILVLQDCLIGTCSGEIETYLLVLFHPTHTLTNVCAPNLSTCFKMKSFFWLCRSLILDMHENICDKTLISVYSIKKGTIYVHDKTMIMCWKFTLGVRDMKCGSKQVEVGINILLLATCKRFQQA